ncbi:hypothetical protein [Massilia sp. S19_KUP03_FR1]|uniref:hypothetical protein n=1 Tax=Massilia sp. S19_KUP03_FR1 TaxID=3025503 RepID=UPI002FCDA495
MHDRFLTSLLAERTKTLGSGKTCVKDDSLPGLQDVRDCVVQLVGQYSESVLWEVSRRSCIAPDSVNKSFSQKYFMWVQPTTYPATSDKPWLVPIEEAITAYLKMLGELIGQGLIEHQLRNCIGV